MLSKYIGGFESKKPELIIPVKKKKINSAVVGYSFEEYVRLFFLRGNDAVRRYKSEIDSYRVRVEELLLRIREKKIMIADRANFSKGGLVYFLDRETYEVYLNELKRDSKYILQISNSELWRIRIHVGFHATQNSDFLINELDDKCFQMLIIDRASQKEVFKADFIQAEIYFENCLGIIHKYKTQVFLNLRRRKYSSNDLLLLMQYVQLYRTLSYGYFKKEYFYFSVESLDAIKLLIDNCYEELALFSNAKTILHNPVLQLDILKKRKNGKNRRINGRPDFILDIVILEIKSTQTFLRKDDLYQAVLYLILAELVDEKTSLKTAFLYYPYYSKMIPVNMSDILNDKQFELLKSELNLYFSTFKPSKEGASGYFSM